MKTLLTINGKDYLIEETTIHALNDKGKVDYINEETKLAVHKGNVQSIIFYEDEYDMNGCRTGKAHKHFIDVEAVKKLHDLIANIEDKRSEETYYPNFY